MQTFFYVQFPLPSDKSFRFKKFSGQKKNLVENI